MHICDTGDRITPTNHAHQACTPKATTMTSTYEDLYDEVDARRAPATTTERHLPAFVYGTLRNGCGNYEWCLKGRTLTEEPATLTGARMWSNRGSFPFVSTNDSAETDVVVGELMCIPESLFADVLRDLDGLEGYRGPGVASNLYDRKIVTVTTDDGEQVEAYTYIVSQNIYDSRLRNSDPSELVDSGDWLTYLATRSPRW